MNSKNIEALIDLIATLRGENGCPWDRKQTPQTIMIYLVEEVYELFEAIESGSPEQICEELGDVFFQILFIAGLFKESGDFDIEDVARVITEKMIHRHPHVFGNDVVNDAEDVKKRWQKLKMKEKNHAGQNSVLDSVPPKLP
ncbi:MAG TPA: nucleoside triphosphate pyrophosphohydrolase, partial [Desulfobacteraceae bacterium]|nr:nucleoside triphosphate pyrophosphohydrolase [Desulfobacteraceae bacterium]